MSKTITTFSAKLVTLETSLPFSDVLTRLDKAINKDGSKELIPKMRYATSKDEIEALVNGIRGDGDFLYFSEISHQRWRSVYEGRDYPGTVVYTIGNPLLAHALMQHDVCAALNVPLRLLIREKSQNHGTTITYHLPSSVLLTTDNPDLRTDAEALDVKLEKLLTDVMAPESYLRCPL
ncbi:hypothetical protein M378DRAFT_67951 [Amanita muscaria Koide BX008]|uniref:DUF302 domain-containing protein n=1 Tax=Amanita muscaria (strain Koide BX008) TaxID=946122 RepID=A0A0C2XLX8_AMAMK|nr:hypothetical protein M378DRAFT_67951 [Amanita muscaria Koide BX008]